MKFHIVRSGETLENILFTYSLSKDELVENNKHIRNWNRLIPGSKIKIPTITKVIDQDIMEMEPFISEYYPHKNILEKDEENTVISLIQDDSKPVSLVDEDSIKKEEMSEFVEKDENDQSEQPDKNIEDIENVNNKNLDKLDIDNNAEKNKDIHINTEDLKSSNRQDQDSNIINKEINLNDKKVEKKEAKPLNKRKVKYYPYYYFNPYYGQYFLYYYPIYE